jgi:hypothetical protein
MSRDRGLIALAALVFLAIESAAKAGMPSFTLADVPRAASLSNLSKARLEVISFFLMVILACAGVIRGIWNSLQKDFPKLPRLSFGKALGVVFLWGLLFLLVLTMISGARELLTPGAWEKQGATYRLAVAESRPVEQEINRRYQAIERLRAALFDDARRHHGELPAIEPKGRIRAQLWQVPGHPKERYIYLGGKIAGEDSLASGPIVAYEPAAVGSDRLVILSGGAILWMSADSIERELRGDSP